jgi:copper resistance protein D
VYQLSVFVHLLSAVVWVGGMLFLALVIVPAIRHLPPAERGALLSAVGRRFRTIGWLCIALLIATGMLNAGYRGLTWDLVLSGRFLEGWFGQVLAIKLALVAAMIGLSAYHDFVVGPSATRLLERGDPSTAGLAMRLRRRASLLGRLNALLALAVIALAVLLMRGLPS